MSLQLIWFLVGAGFLVAEFAAPGFVLVFFAAGSWITALVLWQMELSLTGQIMVFVGSSLLLLFTMRRLGLKIFRGDTVEDIDDDYAKSKIGKTGIVTRAIRPNVAGEIKVMGSFWQAVADTEIAAGQPVKVTSVESEDGLTVKVEPL